MNRIVPCGSDKVFSSLRRRFDMLRTYQPPVMGTSKSSVFYQFSSDVRKRIEDILRSDNDLKFMDQGCGFGTAFNELVLNTGSSVGRRVTAYGVTAARVHYKSDATFRPLPNELQHPSFNFFEGGNVRICIAQNDLHALAAWLPENEFNLVYSNFTYLHLQFPWLALGQTCNALAVNGLLAIHKFYGARPSIVNKFGIPIDHCEYVDLLKHHNPGFKFFDRSIVFDTVEIERFSQEPFVTHLYFGMIEDEPHEYRLVYLNDNEKGGFTSIDNVNEWAGSSIVHQRA